MFMICCFAQKFKITFILVYLKITNNSADMWNPVVRGTYIHTDIETSYLHVITYSTEGYSGNKIVVWYYDEDKILAGGIIIRFSSPVMYALSYCQLYYTPFQTSPPVEDTKHWVIQKHGYRTVIFCNGELVLNITVSSDTCVDPYFANTWETYWRRDVDSVVFPSDWDTASVSFNIGWLLGS